MDYALALWATGSIRERRCCVREMASHSFLQDLQIGISSDCCTNRDSVYILFRQPFVFDNLLFYTSLLTLYLPRLSDPPQSNRTSITPAPLTLTKELRSIQKVMKVYKAEQLKEILKIAEQVLVWPENFTESSYAAFEPLSEAGLSLGSSRPDATSAFLASMTRALQAQVNQFEGHHHKYESLFLVEGPARSKVTTLCDLIFKKKNR